MNPLPSERTPAAMIKTLIAAILALFTGAVVTALKKDKVIIELQREIKRLNSYEYFTSIHSMGYDSGYNRGWLDRNMSPEPPARWNR